MKTPLITITLIIISILCTNVYSQTGRYYSTDNELSSSLINQIYQDKIGFIWIATEYGLNKFDGNNFTIYKHEENNPLSLKNNYVRSLFEDSKNNFYIGCINGLMKYDKAGDSFNEIEMILNKKKVSPHVVQFCELEDNKLLIATSGHGIFIINENGIASEYKPINDKLTDKYISCIYKDKDNNLWIGTEKSGVLFYSLKKKESTRYSYPQISSNNITSIIEDNNKNIIVGTLNNGVSIIDATYRNVKKPISSDENEISVKQLLNIDNDIIIATDGQGIKKYDYINNSITEYHVNGVPFDFNDAKVHNILCDKDKNLWFGIFQKGVILKPHQNNIFNYYGYKSLNYNPLGKGCIMAVYEDRLKNIWVSGDSEGLYKLDSNWKRIDHFMPAKGSNSVPKTTLCMFEDSNNNFWIGSYASGLAILNRNNGTCNYIKELEGQKIYCITEDKKKNVYIGTLGSGFYTYNLNTRKIKQFKYAKSENKDKDDVFYDWINYILCDRNGLIWLAHYKGLSCYDPSQNRYIKMNGNNNMIPECIGYSLHEDAKGLIYAGTSNGLYVINNSKSRIRHFTVNEGLPNNIICGIAEDKFKNIWLSTYMGLSKYIPSTNIFINYYAGNGLQGNEFTHGAFYSSPNGMIYFGGINGITSFYPTQTTEENIEYPLFITGFSIFNKPININTKSGNKWIINKSVLEATEYDLSYEDNTFTIDVSTLQYDNPEKIVYQYRIKELSTTWLSTPPGINKITYNNLIHGKYTFEVRAVNQGDFSDIKSIKIIISPPWYLSWWAYSIYALLSFILVWIIINILRTKIKHRQELMKIEHAEQLNEAKLQFFINISHEIRTPMTLIINPLEKLLGEVKDNNLKNTYLMIYRNSQRILRLINQLMDIRKLDKGQMFMKFRETDIVGFINDIKLTFEYTATRKNINFNFIHSMNELKVWIDLNNFDKILMNILSNGFKYTPDGGEITISLSTNYDEKRKGALKKYFEIVVSDNGIGIDKEKINKIFERFYQIDNDLTQSNFGTGIGLHLCRSLVLLHHGEIYAENRTDTHGSRFIIRIPLGKEHLKSSELENPDSNINSNSLLIKKEINEYMSENPDENSENIKVKAKSSLKILIVEDEYDIRKYMKEELQSEFRVITSNNGKEGFEKTLSENPDLIISDVMMPEMDGITFCKKIKQNVNINHIPVILLTAKSKQEDLIEGMDIGADAYMVKPFNTEILKSTILNLIDNRKLLRSKFSGVQEQTDKVQRIQLKSADEQLMNKIMKTINTHMSDPELNVEMLANEVGISRVHIHRKLKELTNLSARDFIKSIRLKQAAILLEDKKLTISEVAYATGYSNPSHFSNSFKEYFGVGPKEYMEKHQN